MLNEETVAWSQTQFQMAYLGYLTHEASDTKLGKLVVKGSLVFIKNAIAVSGNAPLKVLIFTALSVVGALLLASPLFGGMQATNVAPVDQESIEGTFRSARPLPSDFPDEKLERPKLFDAPMDFSRAPEIGKIDGPRPLEIKNAIDAGVQFLLKTQNKDGSWGSHVSKRTGEIYAPVPGAHDGFRIATTSLSVSALIETRGDDKDVFVAIRKCQKFLSKELPKLKRADGVAIYNVWGHAYAIEALARLKNWPGNDAPARSEIDRLLAQQLDMLTRFESINGGWGYYDFNAKTRKPSGSSISFVNATVLVAMYQAKEAGATLDQNVVDKAYKATLRQQKPDFTYLYGEYLRKSPMLGINRPGGSLGRTQACNIALNLWGDKKITDNVLKHWLYRLYLRNGWLSIGRKRPVPHEAWMQVAGYFYYYGHYYAGLCVEVLAPAERAPYQAMLAKIILRHQEPDGSWWDYTIFNYYKQYGTAFALMTLQRCLPDAE